MKLIGLTGGIACGKTTAAAMLRDLGAHVIDADQISRDVVVPGTDGWRKVVNRFGDGILDGSGTRSRSKRRATPRQRRSRESPPPRRVVFSSAALGNLWRTDGSQDRRIED